MSAIQNQFRVRLPCLVGAAPEDGLTPNALTGRAPSWWRGNPIQVEVGLLDASGIALQTDLGNVAGMVCQLWSGQAAGSVLLAQCSLDFNSLNAALTQADWDAGTGQQALFPFTGADMDLDLGGAIQKDFWLTIYYTTAGGAGPVTVWAGKCTIYEDRAPGADVAPEPVTEYMTRGEALATFQQLANPAAVAGFNMPDYGVDGTGATIFAVRLCNGMLQRADAPGGTAGFIATPTLAVYDQGQARARLVRLFNGVMQAAD